jgi:ATP-dependent HslUV protease ATP-binding subunit HslU
MAPDMMKGHAGEGALLEAAGAEYGATVPLPISEVETAEGTERVVLIDPEYVRAMVASIVKDQDLSRYIL